MLRIIAKSLTTSVLTESDPFAREAAFGFPSLPFTIRAGVNVTFGGDR